MDELDIDEILKTMDDDKYEYLMGLTTKKIRALNRKVLRSYSKQQIKEWIGKLEGYKYVDSIDEIKYGKYIRWIPIHINAQPLTLTTGGIVCEIKITETGVNVVCKNFMNRYFQIVLDECIVFQKLTAQELILLSALDHLS